MLRRRFKIEEQAKKDGIYARYIKRIADIVIAIAGIIIGFLPFLVFAIWTKLDSKGKVIFKQQRVGKNYKVFEVYKLRTMDNRAYDKYGKKRSSSKRVTRAGKKARALSIDELPQLINVLKGEMSIIGPRPLILRYFPYFTEEELVRFDVKPGLTGLAQVKGRAYTDWDKRFQYDISYVESISPGLDLKILFETIFTVFKREGTALNKPKSIYDFNIARKTRRNDVKLLDKDGKEFKIVELPNISEAIQKKKNEYSEKEKANNINPDSSNQNIKKDEETQA